MRRAVRQSDAKPRRRWLVWLLASTVVIAGLVVAGWYGFRWYQEITTTAANGKSAATAGVASLQSKDLDQAVTSFTQAQTAFATTRSLTGPDWVKATPLLGRQLQAIDQLAAIGEAGSVAGQQAASVLADASAASGTSDGGPGLNTLLKVAKPHLEGILGAFGQIADYDTRLSTDGLLPPVASLVESAQQMMAPYRPLMQRSDSISALVNYFLGADHRFLLISQNNAELRATGGFIGTYGLLKIGPSGIKLETFSDIYELSGSTVKIPKPTGARMGGKYLKLRDANWWLDYPTSAATVLTMYDHLEVPQPKVDGVLAIDLITIRELLGVFGPIELKDYGETISADNMIERLTVLIEDELAQGDSDQRKDILVPLADQLLHRMLKVDADQLIPVGQLVGSLADQKRLQFFVRDAAAEQALAATGWAGAVDKQPDQTDLLAVVNAVVWASKMNIGVQKTVDYQVQLAADGSADTKLTLGYTRSTDLRVRRQRGWFGNYLRVYRPEGTTLGEWTTKRSMTPYTGGQVKAEIAPQMLPEKLGVPAINAGFSLLTGETRTLTYQTHVPNALASGAPTDGRQAPPASGSEAKYYRLLLVKQADLEEIPTTVTVTVPQGWTVAGADARRRNSGEAVDVKTTAGTVTLTTELEADTLLDLVLTKA